jgi:hypothetical protein
MRLGFIDLAPSSATTKEGTSPRVVVPPQPSWASTGGAPCGGTLWRRSHRSEAHRCYQIIEDGDASATIAGARSLMRQSSWWPLSGGGKTTTKETDHIAEKEHIRSGAQVTPETRSAAAPPRAAARSAEVVASAAAKTGTGEATSCAQISPGGADVEDGPDRNAGDQEGSADGRDTARADAGDRCGAVGGLGRNGPGTAALADSARAAPVAEAVPRVAPIVAAPGTHRPITQATP